MNSYKIIKEPIEVLVSFKNDGPEPRLFYWQGKKYKVEELGLIHKDRNDGTWKWYFSCFDGVNYFKLCFRPQDLSWILEELYQEGG